MTSERRKFAVLEETTKNAGDEYRFSVIYAYDASPHVWHVYQSRVCNEVTASEIADAMNAAQEKRSPK